jgi:uncharacterized protein
MPEEERIFEVLANHGACRLVEGGEMVSHHCSEIAYREHEADPTTREVLRAMRRTFLTPFDRVTSRT